jgi:hypothetical protein
MNAVGTALFIALLVAALWCRIRPPGFLAALGDGLLDFFGIDDVDRRVALGDLFGVAGFTGLVFGLVAQQRGAGYDAVVLADGAATAFGVALATTWLLARFAGGDQADELHHAAPRVLETEVTEPNDEPPG